MLFLLLLHGNLESDPNEVEHSASNKSLQKVKLIHGDSIHSRRTSLLCHNIDGLFQKLSEAHIGDEQRLFNNS